jgi:cytidine deaminase
MNISFTSGCNVENAAHSGSICAERTAMVKAISEGHRKFKAIAVTSNMKDHFCSPCGNCRQFMAEVNLNNKLIFKFDAINYLKFQFFY